MSTSANAPVSAATLAFDRLAPEYDTLTGGEIFQLLRYRTHAAFSRCFDAGSSVLEVGCGTGQDTLFLVSRGVRVVACDPSEEMVSRSLRRLAQEGYEGGATIFPCGMQHLSSFLDVLGEATRFDGLVSNFGPLNCVEDLSPLGALAGRYLRPGGLAVIGVMGRLCAMETLYFAATRQPNLALRRRGRGAVTVPVAGIDVPTFFHRIVDVRAALGAEMNLESVEGIGVAIPPPYLEPRWRSLPPPVRRLVTHLDALLAPWPPFNRIGDHVLLQFVKRSAGNA